MDTSSIPFNALLVSGELHAALVRLITLADRQTAEGRRVERFLRALYDDTTQGICIADLWPLSDVVLDDACVVWDWIIHRRSYLITSSYGPALAKLLHR